MDEYSFGYPKECRRCNSFSETKSELRVDPFFRTGSAVRLMLVGQDPTISKDSNRVRYVLMLDQPNGALSRWLRDEVFGEKNFSSLTLYATNLVKCGFQELPSRLGGLEFLRPYFENGKRHLVREISRFRPTLVLTLGESAHKLFITILDNHNDFYQDMKNAFTGEFAEAKFRGIQFDYSPCLHIHNFRVAGTYGDSLKKFKRGLEVYFKSSREELTG